MEEGKQPAQFGSRFGYLMVAAGAAIGLGNIWKFPYLAARGGGGIFIIVYILILYFMARPMVEAETAIGRFGKSDTVTVFEKINPKCGFIGWIFNFTTLLINMYYVVVGGWVLKYAVQFIVDPSAFGQTEAIVVNGQQNLNFTLDGPEAFFDKFISSPVEPIIWDLIFLGVTSFLLIFGITKLVEKVTKIIMPALFVLLVFCAIYALIMIPGALDGLKFYILPDFSRFNFTVFAAAATQVLFSVGIGWGLFTTLGASLGNQHNLRKDAMMVSVLDTSAALLAGFVTIPAAYAAAQIAMQQALMADPAASANVLDYLKKGTNLLFIVMTGIFSKLPGGRFIGTFFFLAVIFAVLSSLFSFFEVGMRTCEEKLQMGRKKGVITYAVLVGIGNILCSLASGSTGLLSKFLIPFPDVSAEGGFAHYNIFDFFDCVSGYITLPLGCILTCWFIAKVWKFENYEKELTMNGRDGHITTLDKIKVCAIVPIMMIIVYLNVFGFIQ